MFVRSVKGAGRWRTTAGRQSLLPVKSFNGRIAGDALFSKIDKFQIQLLEGAIKCLLRI